jgi:glycosyltransferase involved in cell wall biosynthesis
MSSVNAGEGHSSFSNDVGRSKISVIVITLDEETCIERCLRSVTFADEIIVVDNGSTDRTREIALKLGARVILTKDWPGFGVQKNRALDAATGDWIFSLDADEWVEPPLAAEIEAVVASPGDCVGFEIPRRSRFCGHLVRYGSWSPDLVLRLFRRGTARFSNVPVHEKVILNGKMGRLAQPMEHDCITDLQDAHKKIRLYSSISATSIRRSGMKCSTIKAFRRSIWTYFYCYIIRRGILDGPTGILVAGYAASNTYWKWASYSKKETFFGISVERQLK